LHDLEPRAQPGNLHQVGSSRDPLGGASRRPRDHARGAGLDDGRWSRAGRAEPRAQRGCFLIANLIGPRWERPAVGTLPVYNPATGEVIEQVPLSGAAEVEAAVQAASAAFPGWSRTPVMERVRLMFRFKQLLEEHFEELA